MPTKKEANSKPEAKTDTVLPPIKPVQPDNAQTPPTAVPQQSGVPAGNTQTLPQEQSLAGKSVVPPVSDPEAPSTKEIVIGAGTLLVLTILFFVIRMYFENYLVGQLRRSPNSAGMAGWGLFGGLFFGGALGCLALVSKTYMTIPVIIVISALSLICFIIAAVASKK